MLQAVLARTALSTQARQLLPSTRWPLGMPVEPLGAPTLLASVLRRRPVTAAAAGGSSGGGAAAGGSRQRQGGGQRGTRRQHHAHSRLALWQLWRAPGGGAAASCGCPPQPARTCIVRPHAPIRRDKRKVGASAVKRGQQAVKRVRRNCHRDAPSAALRVQGCGIAYESQGVQGVLSARWCELQCSTAYRTAAPGGGAG